MRVVVDTNSLMVSIPKVSESRWLFAVILSGDIELAVTIDILEEYEEIISTFYGSSTLAGNIIETLMNLPATIKVSPYYFWFLIKDDPDDNKFVDCAVACGADYIITEDTHFNTLETITFPRVPVLTRRQFRKILFPDA